MSRSLLDTLPHLTSSPSLCCSINHRARFAGARVYCRYVPWIIVNAAVDVSDSNSAAPVLPRLTNVRAWRLTASLTVSFFHHLNPHLHSLLSMLCVLPAVACKCEPNWWACKHVSVCAYLWISITIPHYICVGAFDWRASTSNKTTTTTANECLIKGCVEIRQREIEQWDIKWSLGEVAKL